MKLKTLKIVNWNRFLFLGIFLNILGAIISIVIPLLVKNIIDSKQNIVKNINSSTIITVIAFLIIQTLTVAIGDYLISREGDRKTTDIRLQVQKHILFLPTQYFDNNISGELSSRVINDASIIKGFVTQSIPQTITGVITIIGSMSILIAMDWKLTLLMLLIFPLDALLTVPIGKINEKISIDSQSSLSKLTGITTESFRNIRSVKLNRAEESILNVFKKQVMNLYRLSVKSDLIYAITGPVQSLFSFALFIFVIVYGGIRVNQGTLTIGTLVSFSVYLFQIIQPVNTVALFYSNYKQTIGATKKINSILNVPVEIQNEGNMRIDLIGRPYNIKLKNVEFSYDKSIVLKDINMSFSNGKKIAIVGSTGSGKTTIINLITRLYPVSKGDIYINEINAKDIKLSEWRKIFGVVSQENTILTGSIYENLIFGLDKKPSIKMVEKSIQVAHLESDINQFEEGISTIVGEQGIKLSGGQRQRIQIARAYLRNADILILDEATSSLDSDSEKSISDALNNIMQGKTIIAIAHRLSTIVDSDLIYFVGNNTIISSGTHYELINKLPEYRKFVEEQLIKTKK